MRKILLISTFVAFAAAAFPASALSYDGAYTLEAAAAYSGLSPGPGMSLDISFYYNYLADYGASPEQAGKEKQEENANSAANSRRR